MVPALNARTRVRGYAFTGENILPGPFAIGIGVFFFEGAWQVDAPESVFQVFLVNLFYAPEVFLKWDEQAFGQHGDTVFFAFAITDGKTLLCKINVFYTQAGTLANTQAATIEQFRHKLRCARHGIDNSYHFFFVQDGREAFGFAGANRFDGVERLIEDFFVEEDDGAEGLVLGRGSDFALGGEVGDEGFDFGNSHSFGVAPVVKEDEAAAPVYIGFFSAKGEVLGPESFAHLVKQLFPPGGGCVFSGRWGGFL